jgi:hydroxymethylglutaryl-CoA synthase
VAKVRGGYSGQCYMDSLDQAFTDLCERSGQSPSAAIAATDYFVLHVPFRNMAEKAMRKLVSSRLGLREEEADALLASKSLAEGLDPIADIGNTYTASIFISLAFLLEARYRAIGTGIVGKRLLLASYGSGNTMALIPARVAEGAPEVLAGWRTEAIRSCARRAEWDEYSAWVARSEAGAPSAPLPGTPGPPSGSFHLARIREDGYREYALA